MHNDGAQIVQPLNFGSEVRRCAQVEVDSILAVFGSDRAIASVVPVRGSLGKSGGGPEPFRYL